MPIRNTSLRQVIRKVIGLKSPFALVGPADSGTPPSEVFQVGSHYADASETGSEKSPPAGSLRVPVDDAVAKQVTQNITVEYVTIKMLECVVASTLEEAIDKKDIPTDLIERDSKDLKNFLGQVDLGKLEYLQGLYGSPYLRRSKYMNALQNIVAAYEKYRTENIRPWYMEAESCDAILSGGTDIDGVFRFYYRIPYERGSWLWDFDPPFYPAQNDLSPVYILLPHYFSQYKNLSNVYEYLNSIIVRKVFTGLPRVAFVDCHYTDRNGNVQNIFYFPDYGQYYPPTGQSPENVWPYSGFGDGNAILPESNESIGAGLYGIPEDAVGDIVNVLVRGPKGGSRYVYTSDASQIGKDYVTTQFLPCIPGSCVYGYETTNDVFAAFPFIERILSYLPTHLFQTSGVVDYNTFWRDRPNVGNVMKNVGDVMKKGHSYQFVLNSPGGLVKWNYWDNGLDVVPITQPY